MKAFAILTCASALIFHPAAALASGGCRSGSPEVFKFIKWEFGKRDAQGREVKLTFHNTKNQTFTWVEMELLAGGKYIGFNRTAKMPAASDVTVTGKFAMSEEAAAAFQPLTPLICVRTTEDEHDNKQKYD